MAIFKTRINESAQALESLQKKFDELNESFAALQTEAQDSAQLAATHLAEFQRVDAENKELSATIARLEAEASELARDASTFDEKVATAAAATVASIGHEPLEVQEDEGAPIDINASLKSLKGAELQAFYQAHKAQIFNLLKK